MEQLSFMRLMVLMEIVETGGFGSAAERLNLTQPAVSFHVRALERIFGTTIFLDPRRGVELTDAGQMIYELAKRTVQHTRTVMRDVHNISTGERGRLIIGASSSVGERTGPRVIAAFRREFPKIDVVLRVSSSRQVCQQLTDGELDAGLMLEPAVRTGLESTPVYADQMVFVTAPDHALQDQASVSPELLCDVPIITSPRERTHNRLLSEWFQLKGLDHYKVVAEIQSVGGIVTAVESRLGISALFKTTIQHPLETGAIRILPVDDTPIRVNTSFVVRPDRQPSPLLNRFRDFLFHWVSTQEEIFPVHPVQK